MNIVDKILVDPITRGLKFFTKGGVEAGFDSGKLQPFTISSIATDAGAVTAFTVDNAQYSILGKTMLIAIRVVSLTVSGSPTQFKVTIPASKTHSVSPLTKTPTIIVNAGAVAVGTLALSSGGNTLLIFERIDGGIWSGACQFHALVSLPIA